MIALLEDDHRRTAAMTECLEVAFPDEAFVFFDNAPEMIEWLEEGLDGTRILCLDHDLGPTRDRDGERFDPGIGRDVVDYLEEREPCCPVVIHSSNGPAADGMFFTLQLAGWTVERVLPHRDLAWVTAEWIDRVRFHLAEGEVG